MELNTAPSRELLTHAIDHGAPHLRPLWLAMRDHGCSVGMVMHAGGDATADAFTPPDFPGPMIIVLGDDLDTARGPSGFHAKSIRTVARRCQVAAVISSGVDTPAYGRVCTNAVLLRQSVIIVETRPEQEIAWVTFLREANPDIGVLISTVKGGEA